MILTTGRFNADFGLSEGGNGFPGVILVYKSGLGILIRPLKKILGGGYEIWVNYIDDGQARAGQPSYLSHFNSDFENSKA